MTPKKDSNIVARIEAWLLRYLTMPPEYAFVGALWAAMTYAYGDMDCIPYLVVGGKTKRSGKTTFGMDLLQHICCMPENATGMTGVLLTRVLEQQSGVGSIFVDEAESLSSEAGTKTRSILNIGYKAGQTYKATAPGGKGFLEYPVYAPKCFVLIGDVNDTLRDRSIIVWMRRGNPVEVSRLDRVVSVNIKPEAKELADDLALQIEEHRAEILDIYRTHEGLPFLPARDEEIWLSLFAIAQVLVPSRIEELKRVAMDFATEKTQEAIRFSADEQKRNEDAADEMEYSLRLLSDMAGAFGDARVLSTEEALVRLREISTAPWRKYKGDGLTAHQLAALMESKEVFPKVVRVSKEWRTKGTKGTTKRGYVKQDVLTALKKAGMQ